MFSCWAALEEERAIMGGTTYFGRVRDLFVVPRIRRATRESFRLPKQRRVSAKTASLVKINN
jgi:hypothetical protein